MADLEHWLNGNEHVPCRLYDDNLTLVNELHFLMKCRRDGSNSVNPRSAQKQVKGCMNPQYLEHGDQSGRTNQQLDLQCARGLPLSTLISANGLSGMTEIRGCVSKGNGGGQRTYVQGRTIVQEDRWNLTT